MKVWHLIVVAALVAALYWWKTQKDKPSTATTSVSKQPGASTATTVDDVSKAAIGFEQLVASAIGSKKSAPDSSNSSLAPGTDTTKAGTSSIMGDAPPDNSAAGQSDSGNPLFDQTNYA